MSEQICCFVVTCVRTLFSPYFILYCVHVSVARVYWMCIVNTYSCRAWNKDCSESSDTCQHKLKFDLTFFKKKFDLTFFKNDLTTVEIYAMYITLDFCSEICQGIVQVNIKSECQMSYALYMCVYTLLCCVSCST